MNVDLFMKAVFTAFATFAFFSGLAFALGRERVGAALSFLCFLSGFVMALGAVWTS
jgi:hypothetical protein